MTEKLESNTEPKAVLRLEAVIHNEFTPCFIFEPFRVLLHNREIRFFFM